MGWYCTKRIRAVLVLGGLQIRKIGVINVIQRQLMHLRRNNVPPVQIVIGITALVVSVLWDIFVLAETEKNVQPVHINRNKAV